MLYRCFLLMLAAASSSLARANEPAPAPAPSRVVMDELDLTGHVHAPELQIIVERQPLPDLSTEELLQQIDDRLEDLAEERP